MFETVRRNIILIVTNAVAMMLELISARILSPHIGSSDTVWTIVIGMMLLANAIGNVLGGRLIDRYDFHKIIIWILMISSVFV